MAIKKKDRIIGVKELEIPQELKLVPNWVLWRAEWNEKQQNYGKVPYNINGYRASTINKKHGVTLKVYVLNMKLMSNIAV